MFLKGNKNDPEPLSTLWLCRKHIPANVEAPSSRPCPPFATLKRHLWGNVLLLSVKKREKNCLNDYYYHYAINLWRTEWRQCNAKHFIIVSRAVIPVVISMLTLRHYDNRLCYALQLLWNRNDVILPEWEVPCQSLCVHKAGNSYSVTNLGLKNVFSFLPLAVSLSVFLRGRMHQKKMLFIS